MRVITVGTSNICKEMIRAFKLHGANVHACVSRTIERAKDFAASNGVKFYSSDYDSALSSDKFDTVYIAVPNSLHFKYAKKALMNNKNVILEKPFCSNLKEAIELFSIANKNGLYIFENMTVVHNPILNNIKNDIKTIAPIRSVEMSFYHYAPEYKELLAGKLPNVFNPKFDGGTLMDLNVYNICFVLDLFGIPRSLSYHPNLINGIDVSGYAIMNYDGINACLNSGKNAFSKSYGLISGEKGYIYIDDAINRFSSYNLCINGDMPKQYKVNIDNYLLLNIKNFDNIISSHNTKEYYTYVKKTLNEMKVIDLLRKSGKLV